MKFIPNAVSLKVARQVMAAKQDSPKLLLISGIAGMTASTVLACRATLRLEEVIAETQNNLAKASSVAEKLPNEYPENEHKRDVAVIYVKGATALAKLYAPAIMLGTASAFALTKSHSIMQERNLALTAAYATVAEAFEKYRANVVAKYGEDEDQQLRFAHEEYTVVDEETGKEVTRIRVNKDEIPSMYARYFDEYSTEWQKEAEYNFAFLRSQQNWFNDLLRMRGFVMLNQVYEGLGLTPTSAGAVVGWVLEGDGDSFVDFGMFGDQERVRDFINGREHSILLDFNVDGVVSQKLDNLNRSTAWQK